MEDRKAASKTGFFQDSSSSSEASDGLKAECFLYAVVSVVVGVVVLVVVAVVVVAVVVICGATSVAWETRESMDGAWEIVVEPAGSTVRMNSIEVTGWTLLDGSSCVAVVFIVDAVTCGIPASLAIQRSTSVGDISSSCWVGWFWLGGGKAKSKAATDEVDILGGWGVGGEQKMRRQENKEEACRVADACARGQAPVSINVRNEINEK